MTKIKKAEIVGNILSNLREINEYSVKEVANAIRVSESTIRHYEAGISEPPIDTLNRLADFYKVSTDYIVGRISSKIEIKNFSEEKLYKNLTYGQAYNIISDFPEQEKHLIYDLIIVLHQRKL